MVHDVIVDTLYEESLEGALKTLGAGRILRDPEDPEEPRLTPQGYLAVRIKDRDPEAFARELERRVPQARIVAVVARDGVGRETVAPTPGSAKAQAHQGLLNVNARWIG